MRRMRLELFDTGSGARLVQIPPPTRGVLIVGDYLAYTKPDQTDENETLVLYDLTRRTQVAEYEMYLPGENVIFTEDGILRRDGQTITLTRLADRTAQTFDVPFDETAAASSPRILTGGYRPSSCPEALPSH